MAVADEVSMSYSVHIKSTLLDSIYFAKGIYGCKMFKS